METPELVTSHLGGSFELLYRMLNCRKRWRVGGILVDAIRRLEGGYMRSATARRLLAKYHEVEIGAHSYGPCFKPGVFPPAVEVGRYTSIAPNVRVVNENHPFTTVSTHPYFYEEGSARTKLVIGSDVWIGLNSLILPGCHSIGHGAIVGAGSVVTKNVEPYAIVAGVPARVLRYRFEEKTVELLLASCWWELPFEVLDSYMITSVEDFCRLVIGYRADRRGELSHDPAGNVS